MTASKIDTGRIGRAGEDAAARWLEANGFEIIERNWRAGRYEIDMIAAREGELHIVEVKCRAAGGMTRPEEAITPRKIAALKQGAEAYLSLTGLDMDVRFDLVSVLHDGDRCRVEFIPDAILPGW